jgi:hypothetical protein
MPVKHAIWKVGDEPQPLSQSTLVSEQLLEEMIVREPRILSSEWLLIGRQESTPYAGRIDLLAIAPDCSLILIGLKKNRTPREIVAQAIDYAAWVEGLTADKIAQIYQRFSGGGNLDDAFQHHFGMPLDEDSLNQSHQIILVAAELDNASERIINYLNARDIAINVLFFQVFQNGSEQLLSRAWLIDPGETQANVVATTKTKTGEKEPWNGEFYASFGQGPHRAWADGLKYGFLSAGGGSWYSKTLQLLSPGDRIWVKIPGRGFVGVGRVLESAQSVNDFNVLTSTGERPCLEVIQTADYLRTMAADQDMAEYFVRVKWLDAVSEEQAFNEVGLFGNQNSVCQPTAPKWRHTVERLKTKFPNWNSDQE